MILYDTLLVFFTHHLRKWVLLNCFEIVLRNWFLDFLLRYDNVVVEKVQGENELAID